MHSSRDGAVWKKLALALGDGLAFGVGVNLSNNAAARMTPQARPEVMGTLADRLAGIEQRIEKARQNNALPGAFQQKMVEAVVTVVDARLREQAAQIEKRVTDEIAALRAEMGLQIAANRQTAADENDAFRGQVTELHRRFAESIARVVEEQIAVTIEERLAPVTEGVQPMREQVADLERRVGDNDRDTLELVLAIGQLCLQTAERLAPFTAAPAEAAQAELPAIQTGSGVAGGLPKPAPAKRLWRIPLVSSFFFVSGGLLLLHYL